MDFSKFTDDNFDCKEWVNAALRAKKDSQTPLDVHASTLVMKLQLFIQEVNNALEDSCNHVVQGLPRVMCDMEVMRQEASLLKEQMDMVKEDIRKIERETAQSMRKLVDLDRVKTRMQESADALQEVDNWTALVADVDEVFASQDVGKMAARIQGMQHSLVVLHDVADYDLRKRKLESLKDRLEALLSPKLVAAFNSHSLEEAKFYVGVFVDMDRQSQLQSYYNRCHKTAILKMWAELQVSGETLDKYLSNFFDDVLSKWHEELPWAQQVFLNPLELLSQLFTSALSSLDPPLSKCIQTAMQHQGQAALDILITLRKSSLLFVKGLQLSLQDIQGVDTSPVFSVVEAVHAHYVPALMQYGSLERQTLHIALQSISLKGDSVSDVVTAVSSSVNRAFAHSHQAVERCLQLTEGWGASALIEAMETFFSRYIQKVSDAMKQQRVALHLEPSDDKDKRASASPDSVVDRDEWAAFQSAFEFIAACGEMFLECEKLNGVLCRALGGRLEAMKHPSRSSTPFGTYNYLGNRTSPQLTAVLKLLAGIEQAGGDSLLLQTAFSQFQQLNQIAHQLGFDILFDGLLCKLNQVPSMQVWQSEVVVSPTSPRALTDDLPTFSLSPLPYITEIGDYLLTLPQQLEPFTSQESPALAEALKNGRLPYSEGVSHHVSVSESEDGEVELEEHPSTTWISAIARGTVDKYVMNILKIPRLTERATQQLAIDIGYLCNVLAALDQSPTQQLRDVESLLQAEKERFGDLKQDSRIPHKLVQDIYRMRWSAQL